MAAPIDDNYSDDELAFLPFFVYFQAQAQSLPLPAHHPAVLGLTRLRHAVLRQRSSAWTAIFAACTGDVDDALLADVLWSLQTWPLELVAWDTDNARRLDILPLNPEPDRRGDYGTQSWRILPANERSQFRWNANPFDLVGGDGGGTLFDPGAWLMPYGVAMWAGMVRA